ncbi:MAG: hypothetical protein VYD87_10485, partial [Pseudomonadota bacterium]|nr:hypothetical protein [Pseudomonadota bacterium]
MFAPRLRRRSRLRPLVRAAVAAMALSFAPPPAPAAPAVAPLAEPARRARGPPPNQLGDPVNHRGGWARRNSGGAAAG